MLSAPVVAGAVTGPGQHGGTDRHLPAVQQNIELISKLETTGNGRFTNVLPEQIADVAVHKDTAYLMSWSPIDPATSNCRGGFFAVDISNPAAPRELGFTAALSGSYHGEGAHAVTLNTGSFRGDLLAVNNEICEETNATIATRQGGFDLYDVSNPRAPVALVRGAGDPGAVETEGEPPVPSAHQKVNQFHSVFVWQHGDRAYLVGVDNEESTDVDIFDITNPRAPEHIGDFDLMEEFPTIEDNLAHGDSPFLHDAVVKTIGGKPIMLASYWDAGYVQLDMSNPREPQLVGDTVFEEDDPFVDLPDNIDTRQEGNGHYGEFSFDNRYILTADEDFSTYRFRTFVVAGLGERPAAEFGFTVPIASLPDKTINGPTIYGGYGCSVTQTEGNPQRIPPASQLGAVEPNEEKIVVLQRGPVQDPSAPYEACRFDEKIANAKAAGYTAVIIGNRHGEPVDAVFCGSGNPRDIPGMCVSHGAMHEIFNDNDATHPVPYPAGHNPGIGTPGRKVTGTTIFDGWGYANLYEALKDDARAIGHYAVQEAIDERYATGFGDLSIHEWATDPTEYLGYSAYYTAGIRVVQFGPAAARTTTGQIRETGKFIDEGGSAFWGVEQFTGADGQRYIAGADRDYGLYILRYTGPGAAQPPACADINVSTPFATAVTIPLNCTDANGNPLRLFIAANPQHGTLTQISGNSVRYTPASGFSGQDAFTYRANDGAANSNVATVRVTVGPQPLLGRCVNRILGDIRNNRLIGTTGHDAILGGAGNDAIEGLNGDDCLFGEAGNDEVEGSEGNDDLLGGDGADRLFGGSGDDTVNGGRGRDHLNSSSGNDIMFGGSGNDFLGGGSNDDRLSGGSGRDSIRGESGDDDLTGGSGNDRIDVGKGNNDVAAGGGNDRVIAANGSEDTINCGKGRRDSVRADRSDNVARNCERVLRVRVTRDRRG